MKPELTLITSAREQKSAVRKHIDSAIDIAFNQSDTKVTGYALVTFHENRAFGTFYHTNESDIQAIDLPDAVRNRLQATIISKFSS